MRPSRSSPRSLLTPRGAEIIVSSVVFTSAVTGAVVCAVTCLAACDEKKPPPAQDASTAAAVVLADASAVPPSTASATPPHTPPPPRVDGPCRILEGGGPLHAPGDAGVPYRAGSLLKKGEALELGPEAVATIKDPESGRELRFEGPGLAVPCAATDETWLVRGTLVMRPGTADQPLAELSVVVREGVVLLTSGGSIRVEARAEGTHLRASGRRPTVWLSKEATIAWTPRGTGDAGSSDLALLTLTPALATPARAKAECDALTTESRDLAAKMLDKDASLSELSPKSMLAEKNARSACAVSRLRAFR